MKSRRDLKLIATTGSTLASAEGLIKGCSIGVNTPEPILRQKLIEQNAPTPD
jgi:hypothetical protein